MGQRAYIWIWGPSLRTNPTVIIGATSNMVIVHQDRPQPYWPHSLHYVAANWLLPWRGCQIVRRGELTDMCTQTKTCTHACTYTHSVGDVYSTVMSGWEWHHHNDTGPTTKWTKEPVCILMCVCECVCPPFPPHQIHLKIPRLLHWWKLLPFILTVSASGGRDTGMRREKEGKKSRNDVGRRAV